MYITLTFYSDDKYRRLVRRGMGEYATPLQSKKIATAPNIFLLFQTGAMLQHPTPSVPLQKFLLSKNANCVVQA